MKTDISLASFARFFLILLILVFLFLIRDILAILFIAFLIASGLNPVVSRMTSKWVPRALAVTIIYVIVITLILGFGFILQQTLVSELSDLRGKIEANGLEFRIFGYEIDIKNAYDQLIAGVSRVQVSSFVAGARKFFTGVTSVFIVFVISFYMLLEKNGLKRALSDILPLSLYQHVLHLITKIEIKVGGWLRGELILMTVVGVMTYILLKILGMPYAGVLAVIAGLTEIIPGVGPVLAGVIGVLVALAVFPAEPFRWILVAIGYVLIQQLENHLLVPQVMKRVLGLSPIFVIVSLLIGAKLLGVIGAVLAVPLAAAASVVIQEWEVSLKQYNRAKGKLRA